MDNVCVYHPYLTRKKTENDTFCFLRTTSLVKISLQILPTHSIAFLLFLETEGPFKIAIHGYI